MAICNFNLDSSAFGWAEVTNDNGCDGGRIVVARVLVEAPSGESDYSHLSFDFDFGMLMQRGIIDSIKGVFLSELPEDEVPDGDFTGLDSYLIRTDSGFCIGNCIATVAAVQLACGNPAKVSIIVKNNTPGIKIGFVATFTNFNVTPFAYGGY